VVATIERVEGAVRVDGRPSPTAAGGTLRAGSEVETGSGGARADRVALRLASGASLRLDAGTLVVLLSTERLDLRRGGVYVDAGPGTTGRVWLETADGVFRDIGTQFEVRVSETSGTRLRVREGKVLLERDGGELVTGAGGELLVTPAGELRRGEVASHGDPWEWVVSAAPRLDIEGITVRRFLEWIGRETGLAVDVAPAAEPLVDATRVHGSIADLEMSEAIRVVLASAGLAHRIEAGALKVWTPD
jgi:hypothetical protein